MGSTSKMRDGEDRVGIGNLFEADIIKGGFVAGEKAPMGFSFIDIINKDVEGKESTRTIGIEVPATIAYTKATTIYSHKQFKADCFKGEGKRSRAILSFPIWFSTNKLTVRFLFSEKYLLPLLTSGYLGMLL
ncbi:hypothetical protein V6N13_142428 [Hibiscus sabdariffa]